jgi:Flp pilus assembly protein TadG
MAQLSARTSLPRRGPARAGRGAFALWHDRRGTTAVVVGLTSMIMLGFAGLGTEVGYWYFAHRDLQNAADSAAMSAVAALENIAGTPDTLHQTQATAEAQAAAASYGFVNQQNGVSVTVNIPPSSGGYKSTANAVEVIISEPQQRFLSAALSLDGNAMLANNPTQSVRAVATPATNGNGCVVTLDKGAVVDLFDNGNTQLNIPTCDLYINSDASDALDQVGQATINAESAFITGSLSDSGQAALNTTKGTFTGTAPINDPYANLAAPYTSPGSSCTNASPSTVTGGTVSTSGGTTTYSPTPAGGMMVFCGGWSPSGNVQLNPGLYVVDGGSFGCNGCTITGSNVTIYLTGSGTTYASMSFSGNSSTQLNINAPTDAYMQSNPSSKALEGIAIFGDRNAPTGLSSSFSGSSSATINGVIYTPTESVTFNGNGASTPTCAQIISYQLTFHGNSSFANNCSAFQNQQTGAGVQNIGAIPAFLVE